MKKLLLSLSFLAAAAAGANAQTYMTRTGRINFDATSKSSPEKIEAKNNEVASILNAQNGDLRFQVPIKSFKFERQLMEEHFNENYMESDKYPKAEFKGSITNLSEVNLAKDGTYNVKVAGKLTIHDATNDVTESGTLVVTGGSIYLKTKFTVKLADYKINVPSVVSDKVDKMATISLESSLTKK